MLALEARFRRETELPIGGCGGQALAAATSGTTGGLRRFMLCLVARVLDDDQKADFATNGYVVLRGAVDVDRIGKARAAIAASLARDEGIDRLRGYLADTFCPDLVRDPDIAALLDPLEPAIASLFGIEPPLRRPNAQIAIRFPELRAGDPRHNFHLDGFPSAIPNGVPGGAISRHTLLAGVYLTPLRGPSRGNFVVWPGSHLFFARYLRALDAPAFLAAHGAEALLLKIRDETPTEPIELEVEPGDAVLAHHLLGHGASANLSVRVRETVYFRMRHPAHLPSDPASLSDAALYFDGVTFPNR